VPAGANACTCSDGTASTKDSSGVCQCNNSGGGGGTAGFTLMHSHQICENDDLEDGLPSIVINLPPVVYTGRTTHQMVQDCANNVQTNRNNNAGCSTIFYGGGMYGVCACVRYGYVCDREEAEDSTAGSSIYLLSSNVQQLSSTHEDKNNNTEHESYWWAITVASLGFLSMVGCCKFHQVIQNKRRQERLEEQLYHIHLDSQN